jgi:ABC-type dipeptide/oligopeptide/nickel transport system ATPase component
MPPLLSVKHLSVSFPDGARVLDDVNLHLKAGEVLGLVGESGAGKSMLAKTMLRFEAPARIVSGAIFLDGQDLAAMTAKEMNMLRGRKISLAMQDPRRAMDPVFSMGSQFSEVLCARDGKKYRGRRKSELFEKIHGLLKAVGISSGRQRCGQYPGEWSRGMLQRAQLAMVFATSSPVLILDEVTSALDPTLVLQMIALIRKMKDEMNTAVLLITHDIRIVAEICERVAVMRKGRILETGTVEDVLRAPNHPYTRLLLSEILGERCRP